MRTAGTLTTTASAFLTLLIGFVLASPALADPPDWAPAHGKRDKQGHDNGKKHGKHDKRRHEDEDEEDDDDDQDDARPGNRGNSRNRYWGGYDNRYSGRYGANNYGIGSGTCKHKQLSGYATGGNTTQALGNALGNAAAQAMGQQTSPLLGAIAGAVINQMLGGKVGQSMDDGDRYCFSQVLEYGYDQKPVRWTNAATNSQYWIVPRRSYQNADGNWCREFSYRLTQNGTLMDDATKTACRLTDGAWQ